jgi:P27 family predicted phage terminase small subunit
MKRGRKKEPVSLKISKGTYRRDKDGEVADMPSPDTANLDTPATLGEVGSAVWAHESAQLSKTNVLTEADRRALHTYCRTFDEVARLDATLEKEGEYFTAESGYIGQHPAVNQRFKWLEIRRRYECEFGLTPSSRTSIRVTNAKKQSASQLLGKRTG